MKYIRIAVLSAYDEVCTFLDNSISKAMHYWNDELHTYLKGGAYTYSFKTFTDYEDAQYLTVGNKISFIYKDKGYYLNIVDVDRDEVYTTVTAYGLSLELTNEETGPYKATGAMSFEEYITAFNFEKPFVIGANEVFDKRITHEWEGTDTILARLFSLANVFDAELEFVTELDRNYSLKRIVMNIYREHDSKHQGLGNDKRGQGNIRYGNEIRGISKKSDITELYTAIRPTGADGLNVSRLNKVEYDDEGNLEYSSPRGTSEILAPQARDRFPSTLMADINGRYICKVWSYDTDNPETLYGQALAQLKKNCIPQVSYTIDGYIDAEIGDTFIIEDSEYKPVLYLEARITEQQISFTNSENCKTTFDNFEELQSQVNTVLLDEMKSMINANKLYDASIGTDNGILFKNRDDVSKLTALIKDNGNDITSNYKIKWYKDGNEISTNQTITVKASDFEDKAIYRFEALNGQNIKANCEVTCMFLKNGEKGDNAYVHIMYADDENGKNMSSNPNGKSYMGQYTDNSMYNSENPSDYIWAKIEGKTGKGVATHVTQYYLSTSDTECSNGSWSEKQQDWVKGCYYWTREYTTWTDGSSSTSEPILEEGLNNAINTAKDVENDVVNFKNLTAEKFTAINGQFNGIDTDIANINKSLSAQEASIKKLDAEKLSANEAELSYAKIDALETVSGKFNTLESDYGKFKELTTTNITGITADIKQIKTDNVDIAGRVTANEGSIKNLNTDKLNSADAYLVFSKISDLNATNANITNLNANLAKISTLLSGSVTAGSTETIVLNAKNTTIENALIKDAMIDSLSFNKLKGIDINTTKLTVHSNDGKSTWKDNTIKIADSSRTRVQIGKDSEGDYNIYIWDKAGNLMFDPLGLTDKGVTREVIDNSNVKENAGIAGSKLDIDSVITSINGSTTTIKSSQIKFDDKNQTLDIVFKSMETSLSNQEKTITTIQNDVKSTNDIASSALSSAKNANTNASNALSQIKSVEEKVTSNTTAINTANGKINTLITDVTQSKTDITTVKGDISTTKANVATLQNDYSSLTQTVNSLNSTLGSHTSTIATIQNNLKNTTDKIDNLSIGGRNLLKQYIKAGAQTIKINDKSIKLVGNDKDTYFALKPWVSLTKGETYTISFDASGVPDGCKWSFGVKLQASSFRFYITKNGRISATGQLVDSVGADADLLIDDYGDRPSGAQNIILSNFKLEKGNKATDWTPAPEDTQTQITTISDKQSTFEQTLSGLSNTVSSLESTVKTKADNSTVSSLSTTVNTLKSDLSGFKTSVSQTYATKTELNTANSNITSLTSRVQTAEQKLTKDGITNIVSDYYTKKTDFDNLQVGGRNLLKNSHATEQVYTYPSSSYSDKASWVTSVPLNGDTYTLSFWAKSTVAKDVVRVHFYSPSNIISVKGSQGQVSSAIDGLCDFTLTTTLTKYWVTYKIPKGGNSTRSIIIPRLVNGAGTGTITVKWEKLEEGNKATDWTPAPEDINTSISSVKTVADQTATKFSWLVKSGTSATDFQLTDRTATLVASQINLNGLVSFGGLNSDTQSKINNASSNASTALSTANTAKSTASTAKSTADTAKSTADSAKSTASSALTTANSASSTASTANSNASSALTTANSAKSLADTLNGNTLKRHQITVSLASSSYDVSKYYPVLLNAGIPSNGTYTYEVNVQLNSGTKPSWATHSAGFTCNLKANVKANGWGITNGYGWIEDNYYSFCDKMPAYITQFGYRSKIVFYLRGGGTYYIYSPQVNDSATIYTAKTNLYDSTYPYYVEPTTSPSNGFDIVQPATIGSWCAANDKTLINGAKIYTGSITALQIAAGTITADKIASKAITTDKLNVSSLSAISANLGTVTAGSIYINGKFSVTSSGVLTATSGTIGGWKIEDTKISSSDGGMSVWNEMSLTSDASLSSVQYNKADSMQYRTKLYAGMIDIGYQAYGDTNNTSLERGINISGGLLNFYNASTNSVGAIEVDNSGPSLKISASNSLEVIAKAYTFKINNKQVYMFGLTENYDDD